MEREEVVSSNISSIGYDPDTQVLEVEFLNGGVYEYFDVPPDIHQTLMDSGSKGRALNEFVKGTYDYNRIV